MKYKYYLRGLGIGILVTTLILTLANREVQSAKGPQENVRETEESTTLAQAAASGENQSKTGEEEPKNNPTVAQNAIPKAEEPDAEAPVVNEPAAKPAMDAAAAETEASKSAGSEETDETFDLAAEEGIEAEEIPEAAPVQEEEETVRAEAEPEEEPALSEESKVVAVVEEEEDTLAEAGESTTVLTDTVPVTIPKGSSSVKASRLLAEAGLVESAADFDMYLCENRYDKSIHSGTKDIPRGATYKEIAILITTGND